MTEVREIKLSETENILRRIAEVKIRYAKMKKAGKNCRAGYECRIAGEKVRIVEG